MYSWEIEQTIQKFNYDLPSNIYLNIIEKSPQIIEIKHNNDNFTLITNDGLVINFRVYLAI